MTEWAFLATFYALGFVGLVGISTIWLRVWQFGRGTISGLWRRSIGGRVVAVVLLIGTGYLLSVWFQVVRRVFHCLTDPPCGPNQASGWIALAIFGGQYAVLELVLAGLRRWQRAPT